MSSRLDPFIDALIFCTVVGSLDKMGLNPMLLARQAGREMESTIGASIKRLLGVNPPSTLEEHCKISEAFFKPAQTADPDKTKVSCSGNVIIMEIVDCAYLTQAELGRSLGYNACPLCIQAFCESALTKAVNIAEIESFQVERNKDTCTVKIKLLEK